MNNSTKSPRFSRSALFALGLSALSVSACDELLIPSTETTDTALATQDSIVKFKLSEKRLESILNSRVVSGIKLPTDAVTASIEMQNNCVKNIGDYETLKAGFLNHPDLKRFAEDEVGANEPIGQNVWYIRTPENMSYQALDLDAPFGAGCFMLFRTNDSPEEIERAFKIHIDDNKQNILSVIEMPQQGENDAPGLYMAVIGE